MKIEGGKAKLSFVLAIIAALFVAACNPTPDDDRANARGFNDPDALGDPEDDGLDTGADTRSNARTSNGTGNNTSGSMYGDTATGDTRSNARGTTGAVTTENYAQGDSNIYTDDTRANARDGSDVTVNVYDDDTTLGDDGLETYSQGAQDDTGMRANARDSADTDMVVTTYVTDELGLGDEWVLIRTMTLDTTPEETVIYVYRNTETDSLAVRSNARVTTTTQDVTVYAGSGTDKDMDGTSGMTTSDSTMDTRSNARTTTSGDDGLTQIMLVETETRSSYRGETVSSVDDDAALLYIIVRGGAVAGAVVADEPLAAETFRFNARDTDVETTATVDDDNTAPWEDLNDEDDTRSNARDSDDDDEDDVDSGDAPWNEYR